MAALFNQHVDWKIAVIRHRSTNFIQVFHTETELNIEENQTPLEKRMCYWGHKFEDYLCFSEFSFLSSYKNDNSTKTFFLPVKVFKSDSHFR